MRRRLFALRGLAAQSAMPLLAVLPEVLWAYAWLVWVSGWQVLGWPNPPLSLVSAIGCAVAAEVMTRTSLARNWSLRRVRLVVLPALAFLLALIVRIELRDGYALWDVGWTAYALDHLTRLGGALAFGAYLLWRGIVLGRERLSFDDIYPRFLFGLTALAILLVLWGITSGSSGFRQAWSTPSLYVVVYFFVGLLALALSNAQAIRQGMVRGREATEFFHRGWLPLVFGTLLAIVVVALGIASAFSFDLVALLLQPLNVVANWLLIAFLYGIALPLGVLAAILVYVLRFLVSLISRGRPPEPITPPDFSDWRKALEGQQPRGIPLDLVVIFKWTLVALVASAVVFLLARALFRYWRGKPEKEIEEVNESLWAWETFKTDLRDFLIGFLRRFKRRRPATFAAVPPPAAAMLREEHGRLFTVREIYQGLLWEGGRVGLPRRESETPHEYASKLQNHLPAGAAGLRAITETYVAERYGSQKTSPDRLAALNGVWRRLRSVFTRQGPPNGGDAPTVSRAGS